MVNDIPLEDARFTEQLVRIAYRLIEQDYRRVPENYTDPIEGIFYLRRWLVSGGITALDGPLLAYAVLITKGQQVKFTRAAMLARARRGEGLRSVLMGEYKAKRINDPPVSKTGVTSPPTTKGGSAL